MLASLLAASLASNLCLDGWTLIEALMYAGFAMPSGSKPSEDCPFGRSGDPSDADDIDCPSGCGELTDAECNGDETEPVWPGIPGVGGADIKGEDVFLTNMDFVPSTKRPPSGGPLFEGTVANEGPVC